MATTGPSGTDDLPEYFEAAAGPVKRQKVAVDVSGSAVLSVRNLSVTFATDDGPLTAVDDLSYDVHRKEVLGIVGESGSGKSVSSMAVLGLLPKTAKITGQILFGGTDLLTLSEKEKLRLRGSKVSMVFQDALAALNPVFTVGAQIVEAVTAHHSSLSRAEAHAQGVELLEIVGIPNPKSRFAQYPHEYSGGMRQRAMIAMAIANDPDVLIADEPTTALDVTIQAQVLDVLERVQARANTAIVLITHDLGVVAGVADRVLVMYAGRGVETAGIDDLFYRSRHPYTRGLLASLPRLDAGERSKRLHRIKGQPPSLVFLPSGCAFHPRCDFAELPSPCSTVRPELRDIGLGHLSACLLAETLAVDPPAPAALDVPATGSAAPKRRSAATKSAAAKSAAAKSAAAKPAAAKPAAAKPAAAKSAPVRRPKRA